MADDLTDLAHRLDRLAAGLGGDVMKGVMTDVGVALKKAGTSAVAGALGGDAKYSRWKGPEALTVAFAHHKDPGGLTFHRTRGSAGPWAVATLGRNQGNASGFSGPGINTRTGVTARTSRGNLRRVRARQAKRWNGTTRPLGTWDKAAAAISADAPREALDALETAVWKIVVG